MDFVYDMVETFWKGAGKYKLEFIESGMRTTVKNKDELIKVIRNHIERFDLDDEAISLIYRIGA